MAARWIVPYSDAHIIQKIRKLKKKFPSITGSVNIGISQFAVNLIDGELANKIFSINGNSIIYFDLSYGNRYISYNLNHGQGNNFAKFEDGQSNSTSLNNESDFFLDFFKEFPSKIFDTPTIDKDTITSEFMKIQSALSGAVDQFSELQKSFHSKNQELREQHEKIVEELRSDLETEKQGFQIEIAKKHEELAVARKELDDRSNTHARRSIRGEIKESIAASLTQSTITDGAENKRLFLRKAYISAIIFLVLLVSVSALMLSSAIATNNITAIWLTGIKLSISSISTVGLILLYLRWEGQWLYQQANFERVLASTKVDIDRASWVAESLLEWNRESPDKEIPRELLESFTRRLFDWDAKVEDHQSAQDSLASAILGSAARIQIGSNGTSVEFDKNSIKKLEKANG